MECTDASKQNLALFAYLCLLTTQAVSTKANALLVYVHRICGAPQRCIQKVTDFVKDHNNYVREVGGSDVLVHLRAVTMQLFVYIHVHVYWRFVPCVPLLPLQEGKMGTAVQSLVECRDMYQNCQQLHTYHHSAQTSSQ